MKKALVLALTLAFAGASPAAVLAAGAGSCGKGQIWDDDAKKCVPKPRGSGSGSHGF